MPTNYIIVDINECTPLIKCRKNNDIVFVLPCHCEYLSESEGAIKLSQQVMNCLSLEVGDKLFVEGIRVLSSDNEKVIAKSPSQQV